MRRILKLQRVGRAVRAGRTSAETDEQTGKHFLLRHIRDIIENPGPSSEARYFSLLLQSCVWRSIRREEFGVATTGTQTPVSKHPMQGYCHLFSTYLPS